MFFFVQVQDWNIFRQISSALKLEHGHVKTQTMQTKIFFIFYHLIFLILIFLACDILEKRKEKLELVYKGIIIFGNTGPEVIH